MTAIGIRCIHIAIVLAFIFSSACQTHLFAQTSLLFQHITSEDGLQNNNIYSMHQDQRGFLWIGTENGLHRFDGVNFSLFEHDPENEASIAGNVIFKILEDKDHRLWFCTNAGFDRFDPFTNRFFHVPAKMLTEKNTRMNYGLYCPTGLVDQKGDIYISEGANGVFKLNKDSSYLEKVDFRDEEGKVADMGIVTCMWQDRRSIVWMGSKNKGVFSVNLTTGKTYNYSLVNKAINSNNVYSIYGEQDGKILVGTDNGLSVFDPEKKVFSFMPIGKESQTESIYVMAGDREGNIWLGSNGNGLYKMKRGVKNVEKFFTDEKSAYSLNSNFIRVICEDRQGNLWIGTQQGGINYSLKNNAGAFQVIRKDETPNSLSHNSVDAIFQDSRGDFWFGTDGGGLNFYDPEKKHFRVYDGKGDQKSRSMTSVLAICEDKKGELWAGGYLEGLCRLDQKNNSFKRYRHDIHDPFSLGHDDVRCILEDSRNNFWVATNGGGLNLLDRNTQKFSRYTEESKGIASNYCITLFEDSKKRLWIGTYAGFSIMDQNRTNIQTYKPTPVNGLSSNWIYCIYEDSKGRFWIGTDYGLNLFDEASGKFTVFLKKDGLPNNVIGAILEDAGGKLWISTNGGISRFDPETGKFNNFNNKDGLPGNHFHHGSFCKSKEGLLYFGGTNGLIYFDPAGIKLNKEEPPVYITDLILANKRFAVYNPDPARSAEEEPIILSYEDAPILTFQFSAMNFINAEKNQYRYFLEGFDKNWHHAGSKQSVTYTNLNPGNYIFRVKASNNDGVWSKADAIALVKILPPFYLSLWAYIVYTLAGAGLLYFFIRYTLIRATYRKEVEMEKLRREKTEEIARLKTNFFTNISHELSTPITLILAPLQQMKESLKFDKRLMEISWNNAQRLQKLVRELLDIHKIEEGKEKLFLTKTEIRSFMTTVVENFKSLFEEKKIDLDLSFHIPIKEVYIDNDKLEKISANLISNACKYTLSGGKVTVEVSDVVPEDFVSLSPSCNRLFITVRDNGVGIPQEKIPYLFDKYYRGIQESEKINPLVEATGYGIGLYFTKSLVELHKGEIHVISQEGKGSSFMLSIPDNLISESAAQKEYPDEKAKVEQQRITPIEESAEESKDEMIAGKDKRPAVLIAEDNAELREVLEGILAESFTILKASDGLEGWKLINREHPDLIITDIMMPKLDGIGLCEKIKRDFLTCHIPVIMLTALNTDEYKLKGIEFGADDYITKPFNPKILSTRVRALIESRRMLQKKFLTDHTINPAEITVTSSDEKFLHEAIAVIEQHMENPEFGVEEFSKAMHTSDSGLYRKIKALSSQSPNQFIRTIRLKRAAQLLEASEYNVSEICYMVGFNDVKYFRKCFRKQFGQNPGELRSEKIEEDL